MTKQWTKQLGTSSSEKAFGVATDSSGNVYVAGSTQGGLDGNSNAGSQDLFVLKYNSSGAKQWTKQMGVSGQFTTIRGVATDPTNDDVYVAGYTRGQIEGITVASIESDWTTRRMMILKYNKAGTRQWIKLYGKGRIQAGI